MKTGYIILIIGIITLLVAFYIPIGDGLGNGYLGMFIGYPLVIIGIVILIISFIKNRNK